MWNASRLTLTHMPCCLKQEQGTKTKQNRMLYRCWSEIGIVLKPWHGKNVLFALTYNKVKNFDCLWDSLM